MKKLILSTLILLAVVGLLPAAVIMNPYVTNGTAAADAHVLTITNLFLLNGKTNVLTLPGVSGTLMVIGVSNSPATIKWYFLDSSGSLLGLNYDGIGGSYLGTGGGAKSSAWIVTTNSGGDTYLVMGGGQTVLDIQTNAITAGSGVVYYGDFSGRILAPQTNVTFVNSTVVPSWTNITATTANLTTNFQFITLSNSAATIAYLPTNVPSSLLPFYLTISEKHTTGAVTVSNITGTVDGVLKYCPLGGMGTHTNTLTVYTVDGNNWCF
jgi:hypothetical protein